MTDDIRQALNEAAGPDHAPPFRQTTYDAMATGRRYRRRRRVLAAGGGTTAAAVTAGALVLGFASIGDTRAGDAEPEPPVSSQPTRTDGGTVPLDLGPLSKEQAQKTLGKCARGYGGADRFTVLTARRVDGSSGPRNALVAKDHDTGDVFRCLMDGQAASLSGPSAGDPPEPQPDAQDPFRDTTFDDDGAYCSRDRETGAREYMFDSDWLRVADEVDRVEVRVGTDAEPGVWRVSTAHEGYVYTGYWFTQPFALDATIEVEMRAFDAAGDPLPDGGPENGTVVESFPSEAKPNGHWSIC
jgi:hypothetical protein